MKLDNIADAIKAMGSAFKQLPTALKDCRNCFGIVNKLKNMVTLFANPLKSLTKVGKNIIWHHKDITRNIKGAISAWDERDFYQFGENIGIMIGQLIGKIEEQANRLQISTKDGALFFAGFFEKLF